MEDGRRNNGGNSTKAQRPDDKRLNKAKRILKKYIEEHGAEAVPEIMEKLRAKAIKGDVHSAKLWLEYIVGKPTDNIDLKAEHAGEITIIRKIKK